MEKDSNASPDGEQSRTEGQAVVQEDATVGSSVHTSGGTFLVHETGGMHVVGIGAGTPGWVWAGVVLGGSVPKPHAKRFIQEKCVLEVGRA